MKETTKASLREREPGAIEVPLRVLDKSGMHGELRAEGAVPVPCQNSHTSSELL
jgi:hypothetical protein